MEQIETSRSTWSCGCSTLKQLHYKSRKVMAGKRYPCRTDDCVFYSEEPVDVKAELIIRKSFLLWLADKLDY